MAVDWDKPIQCHYDGEVKPARYLGLMKVRWGRDNRLVAVDHGDHETVIWTSQSGASNGSRLITNVPQNHVLWLNVYHSDRTEREHVHWHESREAADHWATCNEHDRIACIRVEFTEGEGLTDDAA